MWSTVEPSYVYGDLVTIKGNTINLGTWTENAKQENYITNTSVIGDTVNLEGNVINLGDIRNIIVSLHNKGIHSSKKGENEEEEQLIEKTLEEVLDMGRSNTLGTELTKGEKIVIGTEFKTTNENGDEFIENAGDIEMHGDTLTIDGNIVNSGDETIGETNIKGRKISLGDHSKVFINKDGNEVSLQDYVGSGSSSSADVTKATDIATAIEKEGQVISIGTQVKKTIETKTR